MISFIQSFLLTETLMLILNTYKDLKKGEIDSRLNYLSIGALSMALAYFQTSLTTIAVSFLVTTVTILLFNWKGFFASGDIEAISWILFSFGMFDYYKMVVFLIMLTLFYVFGLVMIKITKRSNRLPGMPMILGSWILTILTFVFK